MVAKGGNLVLGIGPTAEGRLQPEVVSRLDSIGQWLQCYGQALYNTVSTSHYNEGQLWFTASKSGRQRYAIYALRKHETMPHSLSWHVHIPKSVVLLGRGKRLKFTTTHDGKTTVFLPSDMKAEPFALQLNMWNRNQITRKHEKRIKYCNKANGRHAKKSNENIHYF